MTADRSDVIAGTDLLREKAKAALQRAVEAEPTDAQTLLKLGEICRQQGDLEGAREAFARFLELQSESARESYLCSLLTGEEPPETFDFRGLQPAPWVRLDEFLPQQRQDEIWELVRAKKDEFSSARITGSGVKAEYRSSMVLYRDELAEIESWFLSRVESRLPDVWSRLHVTSFAVARREIQLTRHMDGAFFKLHRDNGREDTISRKVTFVYYFHQLPKRFEGGDLLLYDTDPEQDQPSMGFTRLEPIHNSLVLFPSNFWHQVTPLKCPADDFEGGRFTVNGWLHEEQETA